jgi:BlaI family penicillinase repressor
MGRPPARELTERELEVMQAVWRLGGSPTVADVRDELARSGLERAYTTVATLIKILADKGFLVQVGDERPYRYKPAQTYEDVSGRLLGDVLERVFRGSREQMLLRLFERRRLTPRERAVLEQLLRESGR